VATLPALTLNGFVADFGEETLRGPEGKPVPLRPQAFAVLRHLAGNPNRLVSKDELMAAVWPGIAVTDDSLVQAVSDIRRAIGDEAHTVLRTVPRRGYKLVPPPSAARVRRRAWWGAGAAILLAAAAANGWWLARGPAEREPPLVAVLPFEVLSDDASARRLAAGLTDDLITDLAQFNQFGVLAGNSTRGYARADPRTVRGELGADFVVTGSIDRQDGTMRITAQIAEAATAGSLWANRWIRPDEDLFAVQSEIAGQIGNRLGGGAGLVQEAGRVAAHRRPPESLGAYELYLLGTEQLEQLTRPSITAAHAFLTRAVALDPGLARAWVELYYAHKQLANLGIDPERNRALGIAAAERAVALDPGDPEAHVVLGSSYGIRDDFVRAEAAYETALRMAPNSAEIQMLYIGWASSFGKAERGADMIEGAIRLDPHYKPWANRTFAIAYFMAGRYEDAVAYFEKAGTERYARWSWGAHAGALAKLGRRAEAAALVQRGLAEHPDLTIESIIGEPGWTVAERARLAETMRLAGFPPCAARAAAARIAAPPSLPECSAEAQAER
jgi:TolB-like protein/DNA-binding winged helix-turn-helix (wHTH) protein/Tfp pilus assembly protein PilF